MRLPFRREAPPEETAGDNGPLQGQVSGFWSSLWSEAPGMYGLPWSARLQDRVWVAERCIQLCSQMIASMPLRFYGSYKPPWVANPDPVWFPNGIGDAVHAAVRSMLGHGDAFLYVTSRLANNYPSAWTVLNAQAMNVQVVNGRRSFRLGDTQLNDDDVVQITRDPSNALRGTSALAAYATQLWGVTAAGELGRSMVSGGGVPNAVLKSARKLTSEQARAIQDQWVAARLRSGIGAPAVLPPELSFEQLSFSASDLALLDLQQFDAKVIASAFSVPAMLLNLELSGGLTYQNPGLLYEVWWRAELRHLAKRVERALSNQMLPAGNWVEFESRAVLAPDAQGQASLWIQMYQAGLVTLDEARAGAAHLPPMAEGDMADEMLEPTTAGAAPAQLGTSSATVQELRPTGVIV